jgi:hypothetical protein
MVGAATLFVAREAVPHDPPAEGCTAFSRDLAHELKVMRGVAIPATAVSGANRELPRLQLDQYYAVSLAPQELLHFSARPGRAARSATSRGGAFRFEVPKPGRYRVSISSRHWIDIVDADTAIESVDHFGPGCELVHKVVEFDLPSGRPLTLQLSGNEDAMVGLAITASTATPSGESR